jgi:replicative DNA helicase
LINVGGTALRAGKTVFHYTLELHENYTARRYDSFLSGVKFQTLKHNLESVEPIVKNIKGQLIVEYQPSGTLTVNQIAAHIDKSIMNGIKPDLIIVDYADLLRCSNGGGKNSDKRQELSSIYIELRGLAGKYNIPVWTATQSNREGAKSNVVKGTDVSEDYSKIMTCDVIISLQRNDNDKEKGYGRWYMVKNRFGPDGITFPSKINTDNGSVQIYAPKSLEGEAISKNMVDQEESDRQKFASSYKSTRVEKKTFVPNGTANNSPKPLTKFSS